MKAEDICGIERPNRKTLCQLEKGHEGSHRAIIFWEGENQQPQYERLGWISDLSDFQHLMGQKIVHNIPEKGYSWKEPTQSMKLFLLQKLHEYIDAQKWVDVANIAFMLWNRENCVVPEVNEKGEGKT